MKFNLRLPAVMLALSCIAFTCKKQNSTSTPPPPPKDSSLVNFSHLEHLYIPVTFQDGTQAAGIYIYADAPDYHLVDASGEGYTCVDDVSRAILAFVRSSKFATDTALQNKTYNLVRFVIGMQSPNGYFYNFLQTGGSINTFGPTSINIAEWWSWRALQALTESSPIIKQKNSQLAGLEDQAVAKLVAELKTDQVGIAKTTLDVGGITVPQWLPGGSGTDQSAVLIMGLIPYCSSNNDTAMVSYIRKLADGMVMMQFGDSLHFPYSCIFSWENTWHAYGNDQPLALMKAGKFLNNSTYTSAGFAEVDHFFPWLLTNGLQASFVAAASNGQLQITSQQTYDQIAYGIRPFVSASAEAYSETGNARYADMAGQFAAWFFGNNVTGQAMYSDSTGICFDGLSSPSGINKNSGAESTIEALLTMEIVEGNADIKKATKKYSR